MRVIADDRKSVVAQDLEPATDTAKRIEPGNQPRRLIQTRSPHNLTPMESSLREFSLQLHSHPTTSPCKTDRAGNPVKMAIAAPI